MTKEVEMCGQLAYARFRRQAEGLLTPCLLAPFHKGNHVYCLKIRAGVDHNSHALEFFEEIARSELKPRAHMDIRGKEFGDDEEYAAVWAYYETLKAARHN